MYEVETYSDVRQLSTLSGSPISPNQIVRPWRTTVCRTPSTCNSFGSTSRTRSPSVSPTNSGRCISPSNIPSPRSSRGYWSGHSTVSIVFIASPRSTKFAIVADPWISPTSSRLHDTHSILPARSTRMPLSSRYWGVSSWDAPST